MLRNSRAALGVVAAVTSISLLCVDPAHGASIDNQPLLTATKMVEVADLSGIAVSPDGNFAVARVDKPSVASNALEGTWYLINLVDTTVAPRMLAPGGNPLTEPGGGVSEAEPVWSADSRAIYFTALHGEELAIWTAPVEGAPSKITNDPANIERFALDPASGKMFYEVKATREAIRRAEREEYERGVLVDGSVFVAWPMQHNMPFRGRMTTFRYDRSEGATYLLGHTKPSLKVIDTTDDGPRPAREPTSHEATRYRKLVQRAIDVPGLIASAVNETTGTVAFISLSDPARPRTGYDVGSEPRLGYTRADGQVNSIVFCEDVLCTQLTREVRWRPGTDEIIFAIKAPSGASALRSWNIKSNIVRTIYQSNGLIGSTTISTRKSAKTCPVTRTTAVCTIALADSPPRLISIDLDSGATRELLDPNRELRQHRFGTVEYLAWRDRHGRDTTGVLVIPPDRDDKRPVPLVITSYRCEGFLRGGGGANVPEHLLAQHGIAALCVNFDGEYLNKPYPAPNIPRGQAWNLQTALDAWESGLDHLVPRGLIDTTKVGVSGHSMTGEAVQYAITHSKRFAAAGATHASITDPFSFYFGVGEYGALMHRLYGLPHPERDSSGVYRKISAALNVDAVVTPVLIQMAEMEFRYTIQYWHELLEREKPAEFFVFPDEQHQFWQPVHRVAMNERFIDWFRFWLQNYEGDDAPSPRSKEQFLRWQKLRERSARNP